MGASALIFSVMMPCKGYKTRVPNFGNTCFSHFWGFPMLGTIIFDVFACSQHREQLFFSFLGVPNFGNDDFYHFQLFPRSGTTFLNHFVLPGVGNVCFRFDMACAGHIEEHFNRHGCNKFSELGESDDWCIHIDLCAVPRSKSISQCCLL